MLLLLFLPIVCVGSCVITTVIEEVTPSQKAERATKKAQDPLLEMQFSAANREKNMRDFGFDEGEIQQILKHINTLVSSFEIERDPGGNLLRRRLAQVDDQDTLEVSFCRSGQVPVRYAAMRFLVEQRGGRMLIFDFGSGAELKAQDWYTVGEIGAAVEKTELSPSRYPDATRMTWAAILAGKDALAALNMGAPPFGSNLLGGSWSWKDLQKKYGSNITALTLDYAALLQLVEEVAFSDGGICN